MTHSESRGACRAGTKAAGGVLLDLQVGLKVCTTGPMASLLIGEVAERTGLSAPTIRYYESIGLVKPPARSEAGYRRYSDTTVEELRFIKKAQALGFSLDEIAEILKLSRAGRRPCSHVLDLAHRHRWACSPVSWCGPRDWVIGAAAIQFVSGIALLLVSAYYTRAFITLL